MRAYKALNDKLYNEHAKEIGRKAKGEDNEVSEDDEKVFDTYAPMM